MTAEILGSLRDDERGVALWTVRESDPGVLAIMHHRAGLSGDPIGSPSRVELRAETGTIVFPGRQVIATADGRSVELLVEPTGEAGMSLTLGPPERPILVGLGFRHPEDRESLLVCWRRGRATAYGVARYSIRDRDTITGSYISEMSPERPGQDVAKGDTTSGFEGRYILHSEEVNGRTWGPHELNVIRSGPTILVDWTEHGRIFCRGFGFVDPADENAFIVTYWKT